MNTLTTNFNNYKDQALSFINTNNYLKDVPKNTLLQVRNAFLIGSVVTLISSSALTTALRVGAFWGTATAIHGLITPLFKGKATGTTLDFSVEMVRGGIALGIVSLFAKVMGYRVDGHFLIGQLAFYALRLAIQSHSDMQSTQRTNIIAPILTI